MKEKKPINLEIGQNVKQIRENAGLTQERLAELIGLGVKHLSAIECGAVGVSLATLKQLCVLLSVPADAILFGIESSNSEAERSAALQFLTDRLSHLPDADFWATKEILDMCLKHFLSRCDSCCRCPSKSAFFMSGFDVVIEL